jgi:ATP-dependent exoDNAse (exonuclease V) beta subunit
MTNSFKPLEVLNASAGSGKTYSLVQKYLKLILSHVTDKSFSHVMAMTFTNKAAFEMKQRILDALDEISSIEILTGKRKEKGTDKIAQLSNELHISEKEVVERAKLTLKQILHQFEDFHVMTIDKFNLRLIRSFSKELDLPIDSKIVLNEDEVLSEIIEKLMDSIDAVGNNAISSLIINYSKEKLEDEETWNFQSQLRSFATILTNEKYFKQIEVLINNDYSKDAFITLKTAIKTKEENISAKASELYQVFVSLDEKDLPGGSTSGNAYRKLISTKLFAGDGFENGFFSEAMLRNIENGNKTKQFPETLQSKSLSFNTFFMQEIASYFLLKEAYKNFYNMALLQSISKELEGVRETDKILRISEFNKLISDLIRDENAPFIYERIGNRFKHFLLDEFQDTSRLQWQNIVPLLHESLGNKYENLIVGDAKQSIYRFKNGLAEQFVALPALYNPENDPKTELLSKYFEDLGKKNPLKHNYRSAQEIVKFNNLFFQEIQQYISSHHKDFYKDVYQDPKGHVGGYVEIISQETSEDTKDKTRIQLVKWVDELMEEGYEGGDICILGNTKKECNTWAIELSKKYKVVSDDSLLVNSDQYVKLAIAFFKWRANPKGELEAKRFCELYFSCFSENAIESQNKYWKTYLNKSNKTVTFFDSKHFIVDVFGEEENFYYKYDSLYMLLQGFYKKLHINELNNTYLHHLSDMVHNFDVLYGPNLELFLEEYDKTGKNSAIQIPENKEAIKIMTGHKSKGLEFPVVILPNLDFSLDSKKAKYLIEDKGYFLYAGLSAKSPIKSIANFTKQEKSQNFIDKLNLCYVMMTRPVERLYIGNLHQKGNFGATFHAAILGLEPSIWSGSSSEDKFIYGEKSLKSEAHTSAPIDNFIPTNFNDRLWFPDISLNASLLQEDADLNAARRYGNQLHEALSIINRVEEIPDTLEWMYKEGKIEIEFLNRITNELSVILNHPTYQSLLKDAIKISNEQAIIIGPKETKRPDKIIVKENETIVVDFKTGLATKKNEKQVSMYKKVLSEMHFKNVKGYLFYTGNLQLQEI